MAIMIHAEGLAKCFHLHAQGSAVIPVFEDLDFAVSEGECVVLGGPSGSGKSTLLRALYANYRVEAGSILVRHAGEIVDLATAPPWQVLAVRRQTIGFVSQFLRAIPRVSAIDVVAEPLRGTGIVAAAARAEAAALLTRLRIPEPLWSLAPATFSGGEQQRINIARGLISRQPILLLDEPTASLDRENRQVVMELIHEAKARGTAVVGIFHDAEVRQAVGDRQFDVTPFRPHN